MQNSLEMTVLYDKLFNSLHQKKKKRIYLAYKTKPTMLQKDLQSKVIKQYSFFPFSLLSPSPKCPSISRLLLVFFFLLLQSLLNLISRITFQRTKGGQATKLCLFSNNAAPNISIKNESQLG